MSACAVTFSSRLARPRTMSRAGRPPSEPAQTASPFSTSSCDSASSAVLVSSLSLPMSALASASVRPWMWALRKFEASCSCDAVVPAGSSMMRFSTSPFCETSTASALRRLELDELDMLQRHFVLGGEHQAGAARHARQHLAGLGQHVLERGAVARRLDLRLDRAALLVGEIADLHEGVDEEAQAALRRQPAGRDMRRIDEAEMLEIAHHIADRSPATASAAACATGCASRAARRRADRNRRSSGRCRASARRATAGPGPCRSWASASQRVSRSTKI